MANAEAEGWRMAGEDLQRLEVVAAAPVLAALPGASLREVMESLREEHYAAGAVLIREGDSGRDLFLLRSGTVHITVAGGDPQGPPVHVMEAPGWLGEMALLSGRPRSATVTAVTEVAVWRLPSQVFERMLARHPELALAVIKLLCARVWEKDREFLDQSALALSHARLSRELAEKSRQLEEVSRHKSAFLASMSHELRTPLNAIIGFAEVLLDPSLNPSAEERKEFLTHILASGRHLLGLINEVLDLSKIEAGRMELCRSPVHLGLLIQEVAASIRPLAEKKGIHLSHQVGAGLPRIAADPAKLRQVLLNLAGNAVKFTPPGGRIALRADRTEGGQGGRGAEEQGSEGAGGQGGWVEVRVEDTGIGIPPEHQGRIFLEFERVPGIEGKDQGTGLGLAIAKRFVELHGGAIRVQSAPGRGSVFTVTLPVE